MKLYGVVEMRASLTAIARFVAHSNTGIRRAELESGERNALWPGQRPPLFAEKIIFYQLADGV
jgi:hypothetical protein